MLTFSEETYDNGIQVHLLRFKDFEVKNYLDELCEKELLALECLKHSQRKMEFVATRILRNQLFGKKHISYNNLGAPAIENENYISISHTKNIVGIACCEKFQIGLDIEPIRPKVLRVKHKFLSQQEKEQLDINSEEEMTKVWSGKEAMYKIAGRKKIIFAQQLRLLKKSENDWRGAFHFPERRATSQLHISRQDHLIISINTSKLESF